jgi:hypothetical protein
MDPNLFHLDWERTFEVLAAIVVLAFLLERALAPLFENRWWLDRIDPKVSKELIAFVLALVVCLRWQFDAVSMIVLAGKTSPLGEVVTAAVIAGGSKASIKLFRDILGFKSSAYREKEALKASAPASPPAAPVRG